MPIFDTTEPISVVISAVGLARTGRYLDGPESSDETVRPPHGDIVVRRS